MVFAESICVTGARAGGRSISAILPACVVDDGIPSDAVDGQLTALCDQYTFFVRIREWADIEPPHIGDEIQREDGALFRVTRVARLGACYSLNARSR